MTSRTAFTFIVARTALALLAAYVAFRIAALVTTGHVSALWLKDYTLYMDATQRWLDGGSFYLPGQLAGPYPLEWGVILYPPVCLGCSFHHSTYLRRSG